jgi:hypothetical protein
VYLIDSQVSSGMQLWYYQWSPVDECTQEPVQSEQNIMGQIMSKQRICVLSLGINSPPPLDHPKVLFQDFPRGIKRIKENLKKYHFTGDFIAWERRYPEGAPTQQQMPYAFKPFCFYEAHKLGYQLILWMDASIVIKQPIERLFEQIEKNGYLIFQEDHSLGQFCKDEALEPLGITREESFRMPSCWACVVGLNLADQRSMEFLRLWKEKACDGITFPGPKWSGVRGRPRTASPDPRVNGHRYDQTAASVIALQLGMDRWKTKEQFHTFFEDDRDFVRKLREQSFSAGVRTHYGILRETGLAQYVFRALHYRKRRITDWLKKTT